MVAGVRFIAGRRGSWHPSQNSARAITPPSASRNRYGATTRRPKGRNGVTGTILHWIGRCCQDWDRQRIPPPHVTRWVRLHSQIRKSANAWSRNVRNRPGIPSPGDRPALDACEHRNEPTGHEAPHQPPSVPPSNQRRDGPERNRPNGWACGADHGPARLPRGRFPRDQHVPSGSASRRHRTPTIPKPPNWRKASPSRWKRRNPPSS